MLPNDMFGLNFFLGKHTSGLSYNLVSRTCQKSLGTHLIFIHLVLVRWYSDMALYVCLSIRRLLISVHFLYLLSTGKANFLTNDFFVLTGQTSLTGVHTGVLSQELLPFCFTWSILQFYFGTMYMNVQNDLFSKRVIPYFLMMPDNKQ